MARIACFADSPTLMQQLKQCFEGSSHKVQVMTASELTRSLRNAVQQFAPDIIFIELAQSVDNPHLFFFLRADQATRHIPIVVYSAGSRPAEEAAILGADGYLPHVFTSSQIQSQIGSLLATRSTAYAA